MLNFLSKLTKGNVKEVISKDQIAELLKTDKEALKSFEDAYKNCVLAEEPDGFFETNSKQAAEAMKIVEEKEAISKYSVEDLNTVITRIVDELLAQTIVYVYDGKTIKTEVFPCLSLTDRSFAVSNDELKAFPLDIRPQLTGNLMKTDIPEPSYPVLLDGYMRYMNEKDPKKKRNLYGHFRQGLDILDLDPITYKIIGTNPNSMGHWLPPLVEACESQEFFKIPRTRVAKVPVTLLQLTRQDYFGLTPTTLKIVDKWAYEVFDLSEDKEYFIKTGTYSSKFDFRNALVKGEKEVRELGEYLLFIHFQAIQMASPLNVDPETGRSKSIYGVSTTNEWVAREYIPDKENNPTIYKGLPLHTEYRIFVDCDTKKVIGMSPYWEPETMKNRFGHSFDSDSPHQMHDYIIYKAHEERLMERYYENKDKVLQHIEELLPRLNLKGQWSIDIMQNGNDFWLIDMALAENSAFYECVPKELRQPIEENWIPKLE